MENEDIERRIREFGGYEERVLVKQALAAVSQRYRDTTGAWEEALNAAVSKERERCAKICDAEFPDNLIAKRLAQLIRQSNTPAR